MLKIQKRSHGVEENKGSGSENETKTNWQRTPNEVPFRANEPSMPRKDLAGGLARPATRRVHAANVRPEPSTKKGYDLRSLPYLYPETKAQVFMSLAGPVFSEIALASRAF